MYGKCPKISNSKVSDKKVYANSADPDQTAPEGAVWSGSTLYDIWLSILRNKCLKSKLLSQKVWNKGVRNFRIFIVYHKFQTHKHEYLG